MAQPKTKKSNLCRRSPSQSRGKEKVEAIVNSAKNLIGERGNDAVSMREIAAHAGISPSSIYQYFPDKNAILQAIMQNYFTRIQLMIATLTSSVSSVDNIAGQIADGMDQFMGLFRNEPALATIWAGVQANTVLREMDAEDSIKNATTLADALKSLSPQIDRTEAFNASLLLMHIAGTTVRLALTVDKVQSDALITELKLLTKLRIEALIR